MENNFHVNVIGGGFAGIECALFLARHGIRVHMFNWRGAPYKCDGLGACQNEGLSANDILARQILRGEIKKLGSELVWEEERLNKLFPNTCNADKILDYGVERLKSNKNIDYFDICVHEINLKEINVIASGSRTEGKLYEWLQNEFGSLRCYNCYQQMPIVNCVEIDKLKSKAEHDGVYYIPFNYEEYISLCNEIIKQRNDNLDYLKNKNHDLRCIEDIVIKNKDALKNTFMKPVFLCGIEKPYAALKLKEVGDNFQIDGFCSNLPEASQKQIINSIKALSRSNLIRCSRPISNSYLNAPSVINNFGQAHKCERLFFAGNIAGIFGHVEGMASGLYVGHNVLNFIKGKRMSELPQKTCIGHLMQKLITQNALNFNPIIANYDIIKSNIDTEKEIFASSIALISKFEEEYNGRNV